MGLGSGDQVDLRGNPLNETSLQQHVPALQLRGVTVTVSSVLSSSDIPDANLRAAMQAKGITTGYDVSKLRVFQAPNAGITNLAGLESATTMTRLNLDGNEISDLTPLTSLLQLTELKLNSNRISDLTPLASLIRLTELELNNNSISDLAPLASLNQLAALSRMEGLTKLKLNGNSIANISHVTDMTSLIGFGSRQQLYFGSCTPGQLDRAGSIESRRQLYFGSCTSGQLDRADPIESQRQSHFRTSLPWPD